MRVMLTGATGFIGGHTLAALMAAGHEVRALVRDGDKLDRMLAMHGIDGSTKKVEAVLGDMTDLDAVTTALEGCDACVHTAAFTSLDPEQMHHALEVNAPGAVNVLNAAAAAECDPIVHLSTMSVIFPPTGDVLSGEDPVQGGGNPYNASKAVAEEHARAMQDNGMPVSIIYPAGVTGPDDLGLNVLAATFIPTLSTEMMMSLASGGWLLVDVRDLGAAIAGLMTPGRGPKRYVAGGTYMTWDEFHARVTEATGRDRALFPTPASALKGMVDDEAVEIMLGIVPGDDAALLADSGLGEWRPVTETLADTVRWLIAGGLLDPEWAPACT
jgi:nucleoside-diphosphate-sugar epimerase